MVKYATKTNKPKSPIATTTSVAATYEGDNGFVRNEKSELFLLGVNFMGEDKNEFYESGDERQVRFLALIDAVTKSDPAWMQEYIYFLRHVAFMRTAPVVALAEYIRAGGEKGSQLVDRVLRRADESAELISYWLNKYGRPIPMAIRRGVARHLSKLDEYSAMKYAGNSAAFTLADAIELTHPVPRDQAQADLFAYLLDVRHHGDVRGDLARLPRVAKNMELKALPEGERRGFLAEKGPEVLADAGMTWERLSSWIPGGMDKDAWEAIIPNMGYMALLRNLRNFDKAGVSDTVAATICAKLSDPSEVEKSMQFPYRFWNAFAHVPSHRWSGAIEKALDLSVRNIPELDGKTLVLVDISGSMGLGWAGSGKAETIAPYQKGAIFGVAQFLRASDGDLVAFASTAQHIDLKPGTSVLRGVEKVDSVFGTIGYGTNTWPTAERYFDGHKRIIIVTDEQSFGHRGKNAFIEKMEKQGVNLYNFNLNGYKNANMAGGSNGRYEFGGLTDITFRQLPLLEAGRNASWPWEME